MKSTVMARTMMGVLVLAAPCLAHNPPEAARVDELRREVQALELRLQALDAAAREIADLTLRAAEIWSRALGDRKGAGLVSSEPPRPRPATSGSAPRSVARAPRELGTVRGKVKLPAGEPIAYVYVENVPAPPVRGKTVVIDQRNKSFAPGWAVIRRGTTLEFPNHDNIYHNVFSPTPGNSFDLGLYNAGSAAKTHSFQAAGPVDIYCNIHPSMAASLLVVPNDLYAKVQPDGTFAIDQVPSGQRKVVAWAPGSTPAIQWVDLAANGSTEVELTLVSKSRVHKNKVGRAYGSYE